MRWFIAVLLLLVVLAGVGVLVFEQPVRQTLHLSTAAPAAPAAGVEIDPATVTKVELSADKRQLTLTRDAAGKWTQPGDWPVREKEVADLLAAVTHISTRHLPIAHGGDLGKFGLTDADKPHAVTLTLTAGGTTRLLFGKAGDGNAYVRIDDRPEVLRIAPDVLGVVSRPFDTYRRRQLFPDLTRVKLNTDGGISVNTVPLPADTVQKIEVSGPDGSYTLTRTGPNPAPRRDPDSPTASPAVFVSQLAQGWELTTGGTRDRVEPNKLRGALAAVPELWVEGFPDPDALGQIAAGFFSSPSMPLDTPATLLLARPEWERDLAVQLSGFSKERVAELTPRHAAVGGGLAGLAVADLYPKERQVTVDTGVGSVTLRIGGVSRVEKGPEPETPPFGQPPPPATETKFHYARLEGNPLVFEVRADTFADLFAKPDDLRDPLVARFTPDEAQAVEITIPKHPEAVAAAGGGVAVVGFDATPTVVKLEKKKGNKYAEREDDKQDRWKVGDRLAQTDKVTELLEALSKLDAKTPADRADDGKPPAGYDALGGLTVKVTAQAKSADGDTPPKPREYVITLSARDAAKKKLAVSVAGWPRVSLVDDSVVSLAERGPLAYRSRRLFDTAELRLETLAVTKPDGTAYRLTSTPDRGGSKWALTAPLSVEPERAKAVKLANDLSGLEAVEYIDEAPTAGKLAGEYGLDKPRFTVDLGFGGRAEKLFVGADRPGKEEAFARTSAGWVFTVSKTLVDSLDKGPLDLLPLQLWSTTADKVLAVTVGRRGETYTVARDDKKWKLSGPFDASASAFDAEPLTAGVAAPKAERYDAVAANPVKHGLTPELAPLSALVGGLAWDVAPALTLAVKVREKAKDSEEENVVTRTVLVGRQADGAPPPPAAPGQPPPGPGRYARFADGPNTAVFVLPAAAVAPADKPAIDWLNRELLSIDPTKLAKVVVAGTDTVTLTWDDKDKAWKADGFAADRQLVGDLVFAASNPPVVRLIAYGPAVNWAEYGLDAPKATVTLTTGGEKPETHTLKLGKELPSGERYVRVDDGPAVGVVSGAADATLTRGKLGLADRSLLAFNPAEVLTLTRKKGAEEFELASGTGWDVLKPTKFKADEETVLDALELLARGRAVKVQSLDAANLKDYGLEEPAAVVELTVGIEKPKTLSLRIGKPVDDKNPTGDRFVQTDKAGPVKVLAGAVANRLLADPVKFKDKLLGKFVDADKVTIARGDRTATFAKVDGTWKMTAPATADAEQADLDALIAAAATLRADELVAEKPADLKQYGLDAPTATVKFFNGDKEVRGVLVGKKDADGKRAFAKVGGQDAVVLFDAGLTVKLLGEYRKRAVWSGVDASQVQSLAVSSGGSNFAFTKVGPAWLDPAKTDDLPDPAKVTDTLAALAGLKAERFAADKDAELKLYGLDKPSRVIVVTQPGGTKTLQIGGEVGGTNGKQVYARVDEKDRTDVFVLSEADTAKLTRDRGGYKK